MPFTSSLPSAFLAATKIANKIANLPKPARGGHKPEPWDPTRCNFFEQEHISNAFFSLGNSQIPEIETRGGDWKKLADLMKTQTVNSLSITCEGRQGNPMSSNAASKTLNVNLDTSNGNYLAAWLVVEVVYLCGGTDLDAWAVKNWLFSVDKGSYPFFYHTLLDSEKALMCAGSVPTPPFQYRTGRFTVWDNVMGNLWPSDRALAIPMNPVPWYGNSLIAGGGPRALWQYAC